MRSRLCLFLSQALSRVIRSDQLAIREMDLYDRTLLWAAKVRAFCLSFRCPHTAIRRILVALL